MYIEGSPFLELIELSPYEEYLVDLWRRCGTATSNGMGPMALEWHSIIAWANHLFSETCIEWVKEPFKRKTVVKGKFVEDPTEYFVPVLVKQCNLPDYEIEFIRHLSREYVSEYSEASDPSRMCPREVIVENTSKEAAAKESLALGDAILGMLGQSMPDKAKK